MATDQQYGVRQYLKDNGYADDAITYNNGTVMLNGKNFINATPQADNRTYATQSALAQALQQYQGNDRSSQINQNNQGIQQKINQPLPQFKAPDPFNYNPQSDIQYQNALQSAFQNAQTATNNATVNLGSRGIGNSSIAVDRANQIQQREVGNVTQNVLPQLIQQAYQRHTDSANMNRQATLDNYGVSQDQLKNMFGYGSMLEGQDQRAFDNQRASSADALAQKQANWGAYLDSVDRNGNFGTGPKTDWALLGGSAGAQTLQGKEFESNQQQQAFQRALQEAGLTGMYNNQPTMQKQAQSFNQNMDRQQLGLQAGNQKQSMNNQQINHLMEVWKYTGQAPAGLESIGVQADTPFYDMVGSRQQDKSIGASDYKTSPEFATDFSFVSKNKEAAQKELTENADAFIQAYGYDGYLALRKEAFKTEDQKYLE